jgi:hypothetical protein
MGQVNSAFMHSMMDLYPYAVQNGMPFTFETLPNCSLISLGRSMMLNRAMQDPDWTHLMFIDADIRFRPEYIHSMILDDKDIVGGFYPKKGLPVDYASSPAPDGEETEHLFETIFCATGFLLIKRHVIEAMVEHYRDELKFTYQGMENAVHLFHPIIDKEKDHLFLTEDYSFCHRARAIGFKCWMSKRFELPHIGVFEFSAENENNILQDYAKIGRIELKEATPAQYFSAMRPPEFNTNMPEL